MTLDELIAFATSRYGNLWMGPLASDTGYSFSGISRMVQRGGPVTKRLEREVKRLTGRDGNA